MKPLPSLPPLPLCCIMPKRTKSKATAPASHMRTPSVDPPIPPEPDPSTLTSPLKSNPFSALDDHDTTDDDNVDPLPTSINKSKPLSTLVTGPPFYLSSNQDSSFKLTGYR